MALIERWKHSRGDWSVYVGDNIGLGSEMIVVELPPYFDVDGLGLNLRNWVIYPDEGERVRVLFWDDQENCYPALGHALEDIACLRTPRHQAAG